MSRPRNASALIDDVRKRADIEAKVARFPDAEILEYLNQSIAVLRGLLILARGPEYFGLNASPIAGDGVTTLQPLPGDFQNLISVRLDLGGGTQIGLEEFTEVEEAMLLSMPANSSIVAPKYKLRSNSTIEIIPAVSTGKNVLIKYIPTAQRITTFPIETSLEGYDGWEEFVILDAAKKCLTKDKKWDDVNGLRADIAVIVAQIKALATKPNIGAAPRVQNTRAARTWARNSRWRV